MCGCVQFFVVVVCVPSPSSRFSLWFRTRISELELELWRGWYVAEC